MVVRVCMSFLDESSFGTAKDTHVSCLLFFSFSFLLILTRRLPPEG